MPEEPKPTFAEQLQKAVNQGQVVLITAPPPAPAAPPLRYRDRASLVAALCLQFKLRHNEGQMLARLLAHDYSTKKELHAAASEDGTVAFSSTDVFLSSLRKRLAAHNIHIINISTLGYGLDGKARAKINELLAEHDAGILPTRPQTEAPEGDVA